MYLLHFKFSSILCAEVPLPNFYHGNFQTYSMVEWLFSDYFYTYDLDSTITLFYSNCFITYFPIFYFYAEIFVKT